MERLGPVFVAGVPAPLATGREVDLKKEIREQLLKVWRRGFLEEPCQANLRFLLPPDRAATTDLDNLLKPCIDALGRVLFRPARRGHRSIWNADDHWIYRFVATKEAAQSAESCGVEITIEQFQEEVS